MNQESSLTEIQKTIRDCLSNDLKRNVTSISDDASLLAAGAIDSLGVLQLVALIEQRYGFTVPDDDLVPENFDTIRAIAAFVASKRHAHTR